MAAAAVSGVEAASGGLDGDGSGAQGCLCDAGWAGHACEERVCPLGADGSRAEWDASVRDEVQALTCVLLTGAAPAPTFRLRFRGAATAPLAARTADATSVAAALLATGRVGAAGLSVTFAAAGGSAGTGFVDASAPPPSTACSPLPGTVIVVNFGGTHGDLPPLEIVMDAASTLPDGTAIAGDGWTDADLEWTGGDPAAAAAAPLVFARAADLAAQPWWTAGANVSVFAYPPGGVRALEVHKGTTLAEVCSAHGLCDRAAGACMCFAGYGASNGLSESGDRQDCGWRLPWRQHAPPRWALRARIRAAADDYDAAAAAAEGSTYSDDDTARLYDETTAANSHRLRAREEEEQRYS